VNGVSAVNVSLYRSKMNCQAFYEVQWTVTS